MVNKLLLFFSTLLLISSCSNQKDLNINSLNCEKKIETNLVRYSTSAFNVSFPKGHNRAKERNIKNGILLSQELPMDSTLKGMAPSIGVFFLKDSVELSSYFAKRVTQIDSSKQTTLIEKGEIAINNKESKWFLMETSKNYKQEPLRGIAFHTKHNGNIAIFSVLEMAKENSLCKYLPSLYTLNFK